MWHEVLIVPTLMIAVLCETSKSWGVCSISVLLRSTIYQLGHKLNLIRINDTMISSSSTSDDDDDSDVSYASSIRPAGYIPPDDELDDKDNLPHYNEEWIGDWVVSPCRNWKIREVKKFHNRDSGFRSYVWFEIAAVEVSSLNAVSIQSHSIPLTHGNERMSVKRTLDSGDWVESGWDHAEWILDDVLASSFRNPKYLRKGKSTPMSL